MVRCGVGGWCMLLSVNTRKTRHVRRRECTCFVHIRRQCCQLCWLFSETWILSAMLENHREADIDWNRKKCGIFRCYSERSWKWRQSEHWTQSSSPFTYSFSSKKIYIYNININRFSDLSCLMSTLLISSCCSCLPKPPRGNGRKCFRGSGKW